jgi:primase-polymerase (primpol)-like protein
LAYYGETQVMPKPNLLPLNASGVPIPVRELDQWVGWRLEWDHKRGAWAKVPYQAARPSVRASSTDPRTWASFPVALAAYSQRATNGLSGIGIVIANGLVGFDADKCRDASGAFDANVLAIVSRLNSYSEISVSGTGIHVLLKGGPLPSRSRVGNFELYDSDRYLVVTGHHLRGTPTTIESRHSEVEALHTELFGPAPAQVRTDGLETLEQATPDADATLNTVFGDEDTYRRLTDEEVLLRAATSANGEKFLRLWRGELSEYGGDHSSADLALASILLYWTQGDTEQADRLFRLSNLVRPKWTRRPDYRARTFSKAVAA